MNKHALRLPAQVQSIADAFLRFQARLAPARGLPGMHDAAHAVRDALADVDECHRRIGVAMDVLRKADAANDLLACGAPLHELEELHNGLAVAAATGAAQFAALTDELRRHILAKLGIEAPEPAPADFDETTWMVASGPKIVATWKKVPGAKKRGRK